MTYNRYLTYFLKALKKHGITDIILLTINPYQHYKNGIKWQDIAKDTVNLYNDNELTPEQRITLFNLYANPAIR